jgi:hypothetical protein
MLFCTSLVQDVFVVDLFSINILKCFSRQFMLSHRSGRSDENLEKRVISHYPGKHTTPPINQQRHGDLVLLCLQSIQALVILKQIVYFY